MARWWRRCAGGGPCLRVPWGEGNGDGGVSARGSCQGGGCTAPRPCPGFPLSRERRWGSWREGLVSGWGMHRPAPLPWIPAFAGTTMGALARGVRVRVGDAPPLAPALDSRFRGNDDGGVGARGSCQGGGCTAPRPCPGFPLSRERRWGNADSGSGACRGVAGSGDGKAALRTGPSRASGQAQGEGIRGARGMRWDLSSLLGCGIIARAARCRCLGLDFVCARGEEGAPPQANSRRHLPFFPIGMAGYGAQRCCRPRARRDDERCQIPHPHGTACPLPRPRGMRRTGSGRRRTGRGGWARSF